MYASIPLAPATWRAFIVGLTILAACSGATSDTDGGGPTIPTTPTPPAPKPAITLSSDSVVATLLSGAASVTQDIDVTPANATTVTGLAILDLGVVPGQAAWLGASLSETTAPAKLIVRLSPATVPAGRYETTLRVTGTNAETRTIRVSLVVRPRPRLVLNQAAVALAGDVGASFATQTIDVTSVDGSVDSLTVGKPDCGGGPDAWLTPTLTATKAPATLRIAVAASSLNAGNYECSMIVSTTQALVDSSAQRVKVSLKLRSVPRIALSTDTLALTAYRLSETSPATVTITNGGSGTLSGLSVGPVTYDANGSSWLTLRLDSTTAPAKLTVVANTQSYQPGTFVATVPIQSTADGVASPSKPLVVTLTVVPRPSVLIAVPNAVNMTVKAGTRAEVTVSVTHSGDVPLHDMGFSAPIIRPSWANVWLSCVGVVVSTPCTSVVYAEPPSAVTPGVYTFVVPYGAFQERSFASLPVRITVTPP